MPRVTEIYGDEHIPGLDAQGNPVAIPTSLLRSQSSAVTYGSRTGLYADLAHPAGTQGRIVDDNIASQNGYYRKIGVSGAGSWSFYMADTLHNDDVSNPHQTTKEQVGLGNVQNTADVDKPVSGPQQAALDGKANNTDLAGFASAELFAVPTYMGDDADDPRPSLSTNGVNSGIFFTPMVANSVFTRLRFEGSHASAQVQLYTYDVVGTDLVRDDSSQLIIQGVAGVTDQVIDFPVAKGQYIGIYTTRVNYYADSGKFEGFGGEPEAVVQAYGSGLPTVMAMSRTAQTWNRAVALEVTVNDPIQSLSTSGLALQSTVDAQLVGVEERDLYEEYPLWEFHRDDLFLALDAAASAGAGQKWTFGDVQAPVDSYLDQLRICPGSLFDGYLAFRVYEPAAAGLHTLVHEQSFDLSIVLGDQFVDMPAPLFVKKGSRFAFYMRGMRSSFGGGFLDTVGGQKPLEGGFDPVTSVWNSVPSEGRRANGIGFGMRAINKTKRERLTENLAIPVSLAMKRCGQSNDEWTSDSPLYTDDAQTFLQTVVGRTAQGGFPVFRGPAASFCDHARAISLERFGVVPDYTDIDGAIGGTAISGLLRGNANYQLGIDIMEKTNELFAGMQTPINVFTQGESDQTVGTSRADYARDLALLARQLREDDVSLTGIVVPLLYSQATPLFGGGIDGVLRIASAQMDAHLDPFVCNVGPTYGHVGIGGMRTGQSVHYDEYTQRLLGALYAWVAYEYLAGRSYDPLHVRDVRALGNDIVLKTNKPLTIDTTIIPAQANYGIEVFSGTSATQLAISSVTVEGSQIRITLAAAVPSGATVRVGAQIASTTGTTLEPYNGAATNFRTPQPLFNTIGSVAHPSAPVHEWLCAEDINI
jgi:hypothetical protein